MSKIWVSPRSTPKRLRPGFKVAVLPDDSLASYVGTYKLRDKFLLKVFRMNKGLYARATGQSAVRIFPLGDRVGKYKFDFGALLDVVLKGDHLEAQLGGQPAFPIFASSRDEFFYEIVEAQLHFERDATGKVVAVVLHQNGRDMRAPRIP